MHVVFTLRFEYREYALKKSEIKKIYKIEFAVLPLFLQRLLATMWFESYLYLIGF